VQSAYVPDGTVRPRDSLRAWSHNVKSTRVLQEAFEGAIDIDGHVIAFNTNTIANEAPIRSLPGYTKLLSNGQGELNIDGQAERTHVLVTKIYSLNSADIQFYTDPLGLRTDWIVFWDNQNTMYHVDSTQIDRPTPIYETHSVGVRDIFPRQVATTFDTSIVTDQATPPNTYAVKLGSPIGETLRLTRQKSVNKDPSQQGEWYMSLVEGTVQTAKGTSRPGIGIVEYIKD
jgi:hypothetical protein